MEWVEVVDKVAVAAVVLAVAAVVGPAGWAVPLPLALAAPVYVRLVAIGRPT